MNNMDYIVRQATYADRDKIRNFLEKAYPLRTQFKFPKRWNWEFVENPFWRGDNLPIWIAIYDGEVIGQTCAMYCPLKVGHEVYNAAWSVDTIVLPEYRGCGIGSKLQRLSAQNHRIFMSLRMSSINRSIKTKFGSKPVTEVTNFIKWIKIDKSRYSNAVKKRIINSKLITGIWLFCCRTFKLDTFLVSILNAGISIRILLKGRTPNNSNILIKEIDYFEENINKLWERTKHQYGVIVERKQTYLNWRYCAQPHMNYHKFIAISDNEICGYFVLRNSKAPEPNIGIIADIYAAPDDLETITAMIEFSVNFFSNSVEAIKCATTIKNIKAILLSFAFSKQRNEVLMAFSDEESVMNKLNANSREWFMTMGDQDLDQYPLASLEYGFDIFDIDQIAGFKTLKRWLSDSKK
jgi:GNAT superfamily N-acetyltransferase